MHTMPENIAAMVAIKNHISEQITIFTTFLEPELRATLEGDSLCYTNI